MLTEKDGFAIMFLGKERRKKEMMILEKMMNDVCRTLGFESEETICFCSLCEECVKGTVSLEKVKEKYKQIVR